MNQELRQAVKDFGRGNDELLTNLNQEEAQEFLTYLHREGFINESKVLVLEKRDARVYGFVQHITVDETQYHLVVLKTPLPMVMLHEVAHLVVFKMNPEFARTHINDHGEVFQATLHFVFELYMGFKG